MESRNKVIVGVVIALVAIIVLALLVFKGGASCDLIENAPEKVDVQKLTNLASKDSKALANFVGFLEYEFDDKGKNKKKYLGLNLMSVDWVKGKTSSDPTKFSLDSDCASLDFSLKSVKSSQTPDVYQTTSIEVSLTTPNGKIKSCTIEAPTITFEKDKHYTCKTPKGYLCTALNEDKKKITVASLTIQDLEFEIDGKEDTIKQKKFSLPEQVCM